MKKLNIIKISFSKEIFRKGGKLMSSSHLIRRLLVLLFVKNSKKYEMKAQIVII